VRSELISAGEDPTAAAAAVRAAVPAGRSVAPAVAEIIEAVRARGDAAVRELTARHDTAGGPPPPIRVPDEQLEHAARVLAPELRRGLELAIANVARVAQGAVGEERTIDFERHSVTLREAPVERAAVYVPGGRAPYVSTVVMGVVTARAAGVAEIAVATPPGPAGDVSAALLGACRLAGAGVVYRMGGAQAVAALALGTGSVAPVDVIVGPGNLYVQEAKRQLSDRVGIDSFAGPSDLLVILDAGAELEAPALDLIAQAEHGPGTLVVAASTDLPTLTRLEQRLANAPESEAACRLVHLADQDAALSFAQALAPEHLQLIGAGSESLAPRITRAGCVFVGPQAGTAFGDYIAGSNHTLPTDGAARFASALGPRHFRRTFAEVRIRDGAELARAAAPIARAEGFEYHARSMEARIGDNPPR
jgi:histidinol dehydrogenase